MILNEVLEKVPNYNEFLTIEELNESSKKLANDFEPVELTEIGRSREGRPISCLKIGEGVKNALLFAFPHPNEPIGSLTIEFLSRYLAENPEITKELGYTWYFIKAIDIDGAALNEGWFKGEFDPIKYVKHYYRPASHEQIEWTFPVKYKKLEFSTPPPETQALISLINRIKPKFMYSLHNAGFCGVYWYVSHVIEDVFSRLPQLAEQVQLPIHRGEPEAPFLKKLRPAIFQMFGVQEYYDFMEENGVENPQEIIKSGTSSDDYLKQVTAGQGFTLVCEMPYFYDKDLGDESSSNFNRRELVLKSLQFGKEAHGFVKPHFESIMEYCDPSSKIFTSVADSVENFDKRIAPEIHHAKTSPMYEGKASIAQAFDSMVARRYWAVFRPAMTARLCKAAIENHPEVKTKLIGIKDELDQWVVQTIKETLKDTHFEVIPIQKLVKVQVGSALTTVQYLSNYDY
ncbi:MAG: M14 family zinc carboxypeptidase [Candidatus Hodarchaeota archaeon]